MSVYDEIGVRRVINASGSMTGLGGSPASAFADYRAVSAYTDSREARIQEDSGDQTDL